MSKSTPSAVAISRPALIDRVWQPSPASVPLLRNAALVLFGSILLTLSAKTNLPLPFVPMTMQTLVVLLIGAAYGSRLGVATVVAYLAQGAMGMPVFAGPIGGLAYMMGPTGGYLAGFVVAAAVAGLLSERGFARSIPGVFSLMLVGHAIILGAGFSWLAYGLGLGADKAWMVGIVPFLAGTAVKCALGTALLSGLERAAISRG